MPQELPEFKLDGESRERAERLTGVYEQKLARLVEGAGLARSESMEWQGRTREFAGEAPLRDVEATVQDFGTEIRNANRWGVRIPAVRIEGVGLAPFLGPNSTIAEPPLHFSKSGDYEEWLTRFAARAWDEETPVEVVPPKDATQGFLAGLRSFLEFRLAGFAFWKRIGGGGGRPIGGPVAPAGGLRVTLSCLNPGLRALASPAYVVRWQQFGMPTTPVPGVLPPGLWLFAADGGIFGSSVVVDKIPARIPPNLTPCVTAF